MDTWEEHVRDKKTYNHNGTSYHLIQITGIQVAVKIRAENNGIEKNEYPIMLNKLSMNDMGN